MPDRYGHTKAPGETALGRIRTANRETLGKRKRYKTAHSGATDSDQKQGLGLAQLLTRGEVFDDLARGPHRVALITRSVIATVALGRSHSASASPALTRRGSSDSQLSTAPARA